MKKYLGLLFCILFTVQSMAVEFKGKSSLSVAGGYVTSLNKVDGSFENGTSAWSASVGTITATASTEFQGNFKGVWAGTGTGTLDLQWTATASNTYEASMQFRSPVADSDHYICAYVGTTETGCALVDGPDYTPNTMRKISVVANSVIGSAFYLRLKHTGSDAFSVEVDDGKIQPWAPEMGQTVEQESYFGLNNVSSDTNYLNFSQSSSSLSSLVQDISTTHKKFKVLRKCKITGSLTVYGSTNGTDVSVSIAYNGSVNTFSSRSTMGAGNTSFSIDAKVGDIFEPYYTNFPSLESGRGSFSFTATAIRDNVVQSWQDGMTKSANYTPVNTYGITSLSSSGLRYIKEGENLHVYGNITIGAADSNEARLYLPNGLTTSSDIAGVYNAGSYTFSYSSTAHGGFILATAAKNYINFGPNLTFGSATVNALMAQAGIAITNPSTYFAVDFTVPIQGWSSTPTLLALPTSKENVFSARITSAGAITSQSSDFINSVTLSDTSLYTIDITKLGLTVAPQVNVSFDRTSAASDALREIMVTSISPTSIAIRTKGNGAPPAFQALPFEIIIQKQSPDYTAPGVFISNLNPDGLNKTSGTTGLIDTFSFSYGTTNATTVCSASPCSYLDQIGNYVSSVTRSNTGLYSASFTKTFAKLKCSINVGLGGWNNTVLEPLTCTSCSSVPFRSGNGTNQDSYGTVMCQGQ